MIKSFDLGEYVDTGKLFLLYLRLTDFAPRSSEERASEVAYRSALSGSIS